MFDNFTIIIPTLNEVQNIEKLILALLNQYQKINILVVDDGSTDGTVEVVLKITANNSLVQLLDRKLEQYKGITASVLAALKKIQTNFFIVMDGDLQHPPEAIDQIVAKLKQGFDLVIAERKPYVERQGFHRVIITWAATITAKLYLKFKGFNISDPMAGFFGARLELVQKCLNQTNRFELKGYKILFDLLRILPYQTKIATVSYDFAFRPGGKSKLRPAHAWYFLRSMFK